MFFRYGFILTVSVLIGISSIFHKQHTPQLSIQHRESLEPKELYHECNHQFEQEDDIRKQEQQERNELQEDEQLQEEQQRNQPLPQQYDQYEQQYEPQDEENDATKYIYQDSAGQYISSPQAPQEEQQYIPQDSGHFIWQDPVEEPKYDEQYQPEKYVRQEPPQYIPQHQQQDEQKDSERQIVEEEEEEADDDHDDELVMVNERPNQQEQFKLQKQQTLSPTSPHRIQITEEKPTTLLSVEQVTTSKDIVVVRTINEEDSLKEKLQQHPFQQHQLKQGEWKIWFQLSVLGFLLLSVFSWKRKPIRWLFSTNENRKLIEMENCIKDMEKFLEKLEISASFLRSAADGLSSMTNTTPPAVPQFQEEVQKLDHRLTALHASLSNLQPT